MEFGKLHDLTNINFALPPDPPGNAAIFKKLSNSESIPHAYIGATGWGMKEWVGNVYPKGTKTKDFLREYARQFNTIELNTTHYRIPDSVTIEKWYAESTNDFRFCPKILQTISHSANLSFGTGLTHQFCEAVAGLKEKLGPCFMQLPPYFGADRQAVLERFLENFPPSVPLAVEVRHESWFEASNFNNFMALLEKHNISTVITDVAGRRDVAHAGLATDSVLVRFVGNNLHPTDFTRLDEWAERLQVWFSKGLKNVYFFTHEPDNLLAPELAVYLCQKLKTGGKVETRGPLVGKLNEEGGQMSLF